MTRATDPQISFADLEFMTPPRLENLSELEYQFCKLLVRQAQEKKPTATTEVGSARLPAGGPG